MIQVDGIFVQGGGRIAFDVQYSAILPSTVVDGQIIVLTTVTPTKITFSYVVPPNPESGDVWINNGGNNGYSVTSGDNQQVIITPGITMQYIGATWVYKQAYVGISGVWKKFSTDTPLAQSKWEQIIAIADSGEDISQFWNIGDRCEIILSTGETVYAQIAGFNHDDKIDGTGTAAISFVFEYAMQTQSYMNPSDTNSGGWNSCYMRTTKMVSVLNSFPTILQNGIKTVRKPTSAGDQSSNIIISEDKLWIPSVVEISGKEGNASFAGEGSRYPLFMTSSPQSKGLGINGMLTQWWSRSPFSASNEDFCAVSSSGSASSIQPASTLIGVVVGFCV